MSRHGKTFCSILCVVEQNEKLNYMIIKCFWIAFWWFFTKFWKQNEIPPERTSKDKPTKKQQQRFFWYQFQDFPLHLSYVILALISPHFIAELNQEWRANKRIIEIETFAPMLKFLSLFVYLPSSIFFHLQFKIFALGWLLNMDKRAEEISSHIARLSKA
jgi:hypothetical protein